MIVELDNYMSYNFTLYAVELVKSEECMLRMNDDGTTKRSPFPTFYTPDSPQIPSNSNTPSQVRPQTPSPNIISS